MATWDAIKNACGAAGSGASQITVPNAVTGTYTVRLVQCMHLPAPGIYALNGCSHGTCNMVIASDIAELNRE